MKSCFTIFCILMFLIASTLSAQINWTKHPSPVLTPGQPFAWDDLSVGPACVNLVGDTAYHMWYDANWDDNGSHNNGIGHATSNDGIDWSKDILNPVLVPTAGSWDSFIVTQSTVIFNTTDSLFHMWYAGWGPHATDLGYIGHATSSDGGNWLKDTIPVLSPGSSGNWDDAFFTAPCVILVDTTYHMWYDGWKNGVGLIGIGHATSADGIVWAKDPANPVFMPGTSSDWDYPEVRLPYVIFDGSIFYMFYSGGSWFTYDVGFAFSNDGTTWTKYANNPILQKGQNNSWDDYGVTSGTVMFNSTLDSLKMWYIGSSNGASTSQLGYATALFVPVGINDSHYDLPQRIALKQNYPNPFNPTTTIEFSIPKTEFVTLKIYNLLGQEVATLVSDNLNAGNHKYTWDASPASGGQGFASGVYLYKIEAGSFTESKKLLLLK